MLLRFLCDRTGKQPSRLDLADLDATAVSAFLDHLEQQRHNSARTRNLRLAAIRSLFHYAALCHPEHAGLIARVLAIPTKRCERKRSVISSPEAAAVVASPDRHTWTGRRDSVLGPGRPDRPPGFRTHRPQLRDVVLGTGAHVRCEGKGRKQRAVPLTIVAQAVIASWLDERAGEPAAPLFPTRTGRRLSRDAVERFVAKHAAVAAHRCPSLAAKNLHPHVLRHSCAMSLLQGGVDTSVIALWLGHADVRSTQPYLHADLTIKERVLALTTPATVAPGRYKPSDALLAFLEAL